MKNEIRFQCITTCSSVCCGGATIITLPEINKLYKIFPITIGFRKIYPVNDTHRDYLKELTFSYKSFYIIGDFIAGNRFRAKCRMLKNSLCSIHNDLKPLQCRTVPFSITFPEEMQDLVIRERRSKAFRKCEGFKENFPVIWDGSFLENSLKTAFYTLRDNFSAQRELMEKIFVSLEKNPFFVKFILFPDGFLEIPIPSEFFETLLIDNMAEFIKSQRQLFIGEIGRDKEKSILSIEALKILEKMRY